MPSPGEGDKFSFERDIKPLFRTRDRDSMMAAFDLFDYEDVAEHADAIVGTLRSGQMPRDGAWPAAQVDQLQQWIAGEGASMVVIGERHDPPFVPVADPVSCSC
jgi:hypothetical protein